MKKRALCVCSAALLGLLAASVPASALIKANQVNSASIIDGEVKTQDLAAGAVTSAKIQDGAVGSADIAAGAVTPDKITGPIPATKIDSSGLNADTVDGKHAAEFAPASHAHSQTDITGLDAALAGKADAAHTHAVADVTGLQSALDAKSAIGHRHHYANVIIVAKSGGDFDDPLAAMASIDDSSATNPCLVKLMPGTYDLGDQTLIVRDHVDLEGSGRDVTKITSAETYGGWGTLSIPSECGVRDLTVESKGLLNSSQYEIATGITFWNYITARITRVDVRATGNRFNRGMLVQMSTVDRHARPRQS